MEVPLVRNPALTCFDEVEKLGVGPEEHWLYFIEWEANDQCHNIPTQVPKYLSYMYWLSCCKVLKFCMVYSSVQTETKLLYGWVI